MQQMLRARAGVSMVEVLVALTLASVLGATATGAFVTQSRFFDVQEKVGFARGMSRGALTMMVSELRMLEQEKGIISASTRHVTVRAPYALGVVCGNTQKLTISRLPADPAVLDEAVYSGFAFRNSSTGRYQYVGEAHTKPVPHKPATPVCTAAGVSVYTDGGGDFDGRVLQGNLPSRPSDVPAVGVPVMLYQRITYEFRNSRAVPGRLALWRRTEETGEEEEIAAPFDPNAGFRFYVDDAAVPTAQVPAALSRITGLELKLDGLSERPEHNGQHRTVPLSSSVFFKNRLSS